MEFRGKLERRASLAPAVASLGDRSLDLGNG